MQAEQIYGQLKEKKAKSPIVQFQVPSPQEDFQLRRNDVKSQGLAKLQESTDSIGSDALFPPHALNMARTTDRGRVVNAHEDASYPVMRIAPLIASLKVIRANVMLAKAAQDEIIKVLQNEQAQHGD